MREILFRGKRKDNGEWVYGYYSELPVGSLGATIFSNDDEIVCEDTVSYIIKVFAKQHNNYSNSVPLQVIECETYEILPETVGQFTGLCDKNGERIFEGDILNTTNPNCAIWYVDYKNTGFCCNQGNANYSCVLDGFMQYSDVEVIGNIHDNPELLEVQ